MRVRFWGTRGSIAKPGASTVRYGGNTSCVEVRSAAGTLIVLDCGTGAHELGAELVRLHRGPLTGHILITHTHWDHIQGLPFFRPLFLSNGEWHIYGPRGVAQSLRDALAGQMQYDYFPVSLSQLAAKIEYHDLVEGTFEVGGVRVSAQYMNHPVLSLGYRLEADGAAVVYATDHEPHARTLGDTGYRPTGGEDDRHVRFLRGADLLIHDTQYTSEEYPQRLGWGHSTLEYVVDVARAAGARRLALFHHDPSRDDDQLERLLVRARQRVEEAGGGPEVSVAAEGDWLELHGEGDASAAPAGYDPAPAREESAPTTWAVLLAVGETGPRAVLEEAAGQDGLRLIRVDRPGDLLAVAEAERPSIILLERTFGGDALALCRALRDGLGTYGRQVPVVAVAASEAQADWGAAGDAGVTDWLVQPFSATYARTRLRAWLLRANSRWRPAPAAPDEEARVRAVQGLGLIGTGPEERFDRLTRLASALMDTPIALIGLIDQHREWFKSRVGIEESEVPREISFCAHAILGDDVMVVPDATCDPRFAENPLVKGGPRVRFYAGVPLRLADGTRAGTLCVVDRRPREVDPQTLDRLRDLAAVAERELQRGPEARG